MSGRKKLRILAELRPTAEGFAGIPQETRLVFSSLMSNPALEIVQQRCFEHSKLVFVGHPGQSVEKVLTAVQVLQRRGQLFYLSDLSSDELRTLYAGAECTICPSIAEGFDLPALKQCNQAASLQRPTSLSIAKFTATLQCFSMRIPVPRRQRPLSRLFTPTTGDFAKSCGARGGDPCTAIFPRTHLG